MNTDYLIIGQGISGTMLSYFLYREGKDFIVIDDAKENTASRIAAGIINPVTGRRYVTTWMIDEVMPFAINSYEALEKLLNIQLVYRRNIIDFFPSVQMRDSFVKRITEDDTYVHAYPDQNHFNQYFHYDFGCGEISPAYTIDLDSLMMAWKQKLEEMGCLRQESFLHSNLEITPSGISYNGIQADKIIFCDGVSAIDSPYFSLLPFAPNKGEVLVIESEGLSRQFIFKRSLTLAPLPADNMFWLGSNYLWEFKDALPSPEFYNYAKLLLDRWLKHPYKIVSHLASVRPATLERRPFVGFHPQFPSIGILNGMGSKGTSLAPFFAGEMAAHLVHGLPFTPEASVNRFSRTLSKP